MPKRILDTFKDRVKHKDDQNSLWGAVSGRSKLWGKVNPFEKMRTVTRL